MADRIGQQLGNYQIISLLGRGAFAEVYLGEHVYLKTRAAIKVLQARLAKDDMEGFLTEARTVAKLVHPNIVRVLEFGLEGNTPFLVMDYAPNGSLRQLQPKGTALPTATVTSYVSQVAAALQYAHNERLIHRDIKPENMLVGRQNEILLSDFGIALIAQSSRYESNQDIAGTVAYMSPEQIQGKPRPASDQYSLGVVAYEWLSGDRPFHGSFTELCTQHMVAPPPSLREKAPTISPEIEQVVMMALAKDPKGRFKSVQAFANALEQASKSAQVPLIQARPDPLPTPPPVTEPDLATPSSIPPLDPEHHISTRPEQNIPAPVANAPEQALVSPPLSRLPPTVKAVPFSSTPAPTPQPPIILPAVVPPKQQDFAPRRPDTPLVAAQPKPRPNYYRLIILIAVVLLLVLGSVLIGPTLFKGQQTTPSSTATTPTTPATVHATATATPPLSVLNPQQLYTTITNRQPTLNGPLSAQDQNQWDQNNACAFTNGMYQITNTTTNQYLPCMARNTNFTNFAYQVQMTFLTIFTGNTGGGGLIFRSDQAVKTFYRFSLDSSGLYKLFICQPQLCANTQNSNGTRLIQQNVPNTAHFNTLANTLTVIANGQNIYLYINGASVFRGSDSTASAGEIGLYGFSSSRVAFSNLKVWQLPG